MANLKLDAVNDMLSAIGESEVNSLETRAVDARTALRVLDRTTKRVLQRGWSYNTEHRVELAVTASGEVHLPANILKVDYLAVKTGQVKVIVQRGLRLYDRTNKTYRIDVPVYVDMVLELKFEELPETTRTYITARATRIFQAGYVGSAQVHEHIKEEERAAWVELLRAETEEADQTVFDNPEMRPYLDRSL